MRMRFCAVARSPAFTSCSFAFIPSCAASSSSRVQIARTSALSLFIPSTIADVAPNVSAIVPNSPLEPAMVTASAIIAGASRSAAHSSDVNDCLSVMSRPRWWSYSVAAGPRTKRIVPLSIFWST